MDRSQDEETLRVAETEAQAAAPVTDRRRWLVLGAVAAAVVLTGAGIAFAVGGDDDDGQRVSAGRAMLAVRAALDATMESGGYEIRFETQSTGTRSGAQTVEGHGTLNVRPYALTTVANVSGLGAITVRTDGISIWEHGGGQYGLLPDGTEGPGRALSGFAGLVESTIGEGPGAVSMLNLASPTGYLALAAPSVTSASAAGTGTVDGAPVRFYDAHVDLRRLADLPDLLAEQRSTIADASGTLDRAGYEGTDVRIAVDEQGYVVETTALTVFGDGARFRTHTVLSHFGCVGRVVMPDASAGSTSGPSDGCAVVDPATSSTAPGGPSGTTVASTSTTTPVPEIVTTTTSDTAPTGSTSSTSTTTTTAP